MTVTETTIGNILTRTTGFLRTVTSHSLQPYRGCSYGNSLCGVGCYVQHNRHVVRGREWGSFLEVRTNAAESYLAHCESERAWARRRELAFSIFCSSSTDPFVPQEARYGVMRGVLEAMLRRPPDELIVQTHSPLVTREIERLSRLAERCRVRVHVSIETDRESLPGLPPPAASVEKRLAACGATREAGLFTVVTVAPLLPIADPERFFARIGAVADAVVLDHFIGGDGSPDGARTRQTELPAVMALLEPQSLSLEYRDAMVAVARRHVARVGVSRDGFAGRYLFSKSGIAN
jgi:DNA repair photolyase